MDRVALVAWLWFIGWTVAGREVGGLLFQCPGTGMVWGFIFALVSVFAWPWLMPRKLDDWIYNAPA